jgi:hypothetical protein
MLFDLTFPCYLTTFSRKRCLSGKDIGFFFPAYLSSPVHRALSRSLSFHCSHLWTPVSSRCQPPLTSSREECPPLSARRARPPPRGPTQAPEAIPASRPQTLVSSRSPLKYPSPRLRHPSTRRGWVTPNSKVHFAILSSNVTMNNEHKESTKEPKSRNIYK